MIPPWKKRHEIGKSQKKECACLIAWDYISRTSDTVQDNSFFKKMKNKPNQIKPKLAKIEGMAQTFKIHFHIQNYQGYINTNKTNMQVPFSLSPKHEFIARKKDSILLSYLT